MVFTLSLTCAHAQYTVKVLTTTTRYELLSKDMDINAGSYLDGSRTMAELGEDTLKYILRAASGKKTKGELAGHHQVSQPIVRASPPLMLHATSAMYVCI